MGKRIIVNLDYKSSTGYVMLFCNTFGQVTKIDISMTSNQLNKLLDEIDLIGLSSAIVVSILYRLTHATIDSVSEFLQSA